MIWLGVGLFALILFFWVRSTYNGLVDLSNDVDSQWGNVQSSYQRRKDLIPNLVGTVKGVAKFEKETYIGVAEARSGKSPAQPAQQAAVPIDKTPEYADATKNVDAANSYKPTAAELTPETMNKYAMLQSAAKTSIDNLFNISIERYPDLKAPQNFSKLQDQLEGTENRINVERDKFNNVATGYNKKVQRFPGNIIASIFGFDKKPYFEADPDAKKAPVVDFEK